MKSKRRYVSVLAVMAVLLMAGLCLSGCGDGDGSGTGGKGSGILSSTEDIGLYDVDGGGWCYAFTYNGEEFRTQYAYDCWTIFDSYKITNEDDMTIICQALIDVHPVHGKDLESFRTAEDMAYEWDQHNLAYAILPEDNAWRESARNVDLDPADQGRSFEEIYEDRTGQELDIKKYIKEGLENGDLLEKVKNLLK